MTDKKRKSIHEIAAEYRDANYQKSVLSKEQIEKLHEARLLQMRINHLEAKMALMETDIELNKRR